VWLKNATVFFCQNSGMPAGSDWSRMEQAFSGQSRELLDESLAQETGVQHLGFKLGEDEFLFAVDQVREIIMLPTITFVPKAPAAVEGVLALRGEIMPVLNLRRLWGLSRGAPSSHTRVLILQHEDAGFGVIVDAITDFISLDLKHVESVPSNFFSQEYSVLQGVAKVGAKVLGVIGFEKLLELLPHLHDEQVERSA
jgi:purine-binding chemotaxis protein CheW